MDGYPANFGEYARLGLVFTAAAVLFSAVFVSRLIFDFEVDVLKAKRILLTWRKMA